MKLTLFFSGLIALATALPTAQQPGLALDGHEDDNAHSQSATMVARGDSCEDCKARYDHCVWLSGTSGLAGCENVCKQRAFMNSDVCPKCDGRFYAHGKVSSRRDLVAASSFISEALSAGEMTPRDADETFIALVGDADTVV